MYSLSTQYPLMYSLRIPLNSNVFWDTLSVHKGKIAERIVRQGKCRNNCTCGENVERIVHKGKMWKGLYMVGKCGKNCTWWENVERIVHKGKMWKELYIRGKCGKDCA